MPGKEASKLSPQIGEVSCPVVAQVGLLGRICDCVLNPFEGCEEPIEAKLADEETPPNQAKPFEATKNVAKSGKLKNV